MNENKDNLTGSIYVPEQIHGKSAYEIALENGFEGTVEQWLASLKGEPGDTPYIKDGYWYIGDNNLGVKAVGIDGKDYVFTEADKDDITQRVLNEMEQAEDYTYGG